MSIEAETLNQTKIEMETMMGGKREGGDTNDL